MTELNTNDRSTFHCLREWISNVDTIWLTSIPACIAVIIMILSPQLDLPTSSQANKIVAVCVFGLGGVSSLVVVIRKEFPFFRKIKGKPAVILGTVGLLMSWIISMGILISMFLALVRQ